MLKNVKISNFLSFDEETSFSFDKNQIATKDFKGKSNFFKALVILKLISKNNLQHSIQKYLVSYLMNDKPIKFEINFEVEDVEYFYSVDFLNGFIKEEKLDTLKDNVRTLVFNRVDDGFVYAKEKEYTNFLISELSSTINIHKNRNVKNKINEIDVLQNYLSNFCFNSTFKLINDSFLEFNLSTFSEMLNDNSYLRELFIETLKQEDPELDSIELIESYSHQKGITKCLFFKYIKNEESVLIPFYLSSDSFKYISEMFFNFVLDENDSIKNYFCDDFSTQLKDNTKKFLEESLKKNGDFYFF